MLDIYIRHTYFLIIDHVTSILYTRGEFLCQNKGIYLRVYSAITEAIEMPEKKTSRSI